MKEQAKSRKAKEPSPEPAAEPTSTEPAADDDEADEAAAEKALVENEIPSINFEQTNLLPEEFLASDSEAEEEEAGGAPAPKRRKAAKRSEPRDKRVGGTVYRVVKGVDGRMAPKKEGRARAVRANLVKRGREGAKKGGFVVGNKRVDWGTSRKC